MNNEERESVIEQILVALDASSSSMVALQAAAHLAAALEAELNGLYVEDINLLRWADLPFTRVVRYPAPVDEEINAADMERYLHRRAESARRALARIANELDVPWSFKVVRGQVTAELLAAALQADLLVLGWLSHPRTRRIQLGSTARALATQSPGAVWLPAREPAAEDAPVFVTYDDSAVARKALALADHLAAQAPIICVLTGPADSVRQLKEDVMNHLTTRESRHVLFRHLPEVSAENLVRLVQMEHGGVLVTGEEMPLSSTALDYLLNHLECSLLLVR